jgi:hypothetical protein
MSGRHDQDATEPVKIECPYEPLHVHFYPADWQFGGANGLDPRSDPRWENTTYVYLDHNLREIWTTQTPLCLDQAIDEFTKHAEVGATFLQYGPPRGPLELAPWRYSAKEDTAYPLGVKE